MEMRRFGDLSGPFIKPTCGGIASSLILLLHGWGADGNDLANLAHPISVRFPGAAFFVPNGPIPAPNGPLGMIFGPKQNFDILRFSSPPSVHPPIGAPPNPESLAGLPRGLVLGGACTSRQRRHPKKTTAQ